jgi:head-tail adaptor
MIGKKTILVLSEATETTGTQAEVIKAWTDLEYVKGQLTPTSGNERFVDGKWRVFANYTFYPETPIKNTITEKMIFRLPAQQREFDIQGVDNLVEQGIFLKIDLLERT